MFSNDIVCPSMPLLLKKNKMDFKTFCQTHQQSIILLEGKRLVKTDDQSKLIQIGKLLATHLPNATFRSGNADGSDYYFSKGVSEVNPNQLEVMTPYTHHRNKYNLAGTIHSLDDVNLVNEPEVVYYSKNHKPTQSLVDKYLDGKKDQYAIKAAYILRDTIKVLGTNAGIPPITVALFYEDLENPMQGGTGHTQRVCQENNITFINQSTYFEWL
jgi:hypothetical protein